MDAASRWSPRSKLIAVALLIVAIGLGVYIIGLHDPKADAKAACKDEILTKLTDPDSATFVMRDSMKDAGGYRFILAVESGDGFGGYVTQQFGCTVTKQGEVSLQAL